MVMADSSSVMAVLQGFLSFVGDSMQKAVLMISSLLQNIFFAGGKMSQAGIIAIIVIAIIVIYGVSKLKG